MKVLRVAKSISVAKISVCCIPSMRPDACIFATALAEPSCNYAIMLFLLLRLRHCLYRTVIVRVTACASIRVMMTDAVVKSVAIRQPALHPQIVWTATNARREIGAPKNLKPRQWASTEKADSFSSRYSPFQFENIDRLRRCCQAGPGFRSWRPSVLHGCLRLSSGRGPAGEFWLYSR